MRGDPQLRLRTKLVIAMAFAALVPVLVVALLATGVILSSLERSLREDADRQLTVGLNLLLRSVERLGDETVQLAESSELAQALGNPAALDAWVAHESFHVPSSRLQLLDPSGRVIFDHVVGGNDARFADLGVAPGDPLIENGRAWGRAVALVAIGDRMIVRSVSPIVDAGLALLGVIVLSTPFDGDFADGIKGALSADVLVGGPSGTLQSTFRGPLGGRSPPIQLAAADRVAVLHGNRLIRDLDVGEAAEGTGGTEGAEGAEGAYEIAVSALFDRKYSTTGVIGVAVDRGPLASTKRLAVRSLVAGGLAALAFAMILALFWSRRLGAPIAELHSGALAVSRGDLDHRIEVPAGDELGDLANAFNQMTQTLQDNQARLAARMREIVALHDAGRAVSSVIDMDAVSRKIVDAVTRTLDVQIAALWLVEGDGATCRPAASRSRQAAVPSFITDESLDVAHALRPIAERVRHTRRALRFDHAGTDPTFGPAAIEAGAPGPMVALPLDRKVRVVGVLVVGRAADARQFSEADLNLLTTFADQAGAAVENALLYAEVREASEALERKVRMRTIELTSTNHELGRALDDLRETQAQLILSERMAGLGLLVAGVAHEINSPTAAIRGSIDGLTAAIARVSRHGAALAARSAPSSVADMLESLAPVLAERPLPTGLTARKVAREIVAALETVDAPVFAQPQTMAAELADLGATPDDALRLIDSIDGSRLLAPHVVAALTDHVYLHRTASTVRHAVAQIQRIVGALKSYSHLDHQAVRTDADVHEGLETTLALLHHALRDIVVERHYGRTPHIPVFVDELNQVWTNLIQNAQQALTSRPAGEARITIASDVEDSWVVVRVTDNGPGITPDVVPRIFEPFFTTKPKGEGTGLGLGIARQIVHKHGGSMRCESMPGATTFEVRLPIGRPA